ncbi:hypothetical protein [Rhodococcus sp. NPDC058514]|uniref:hypothetical protein n=1 Tax=unclassified Rhodococcus (in: high G+C Gram-positive bacteria) TaxID=192944 RepID=UPI0036631753
MSPAIRRVARLAATATLAAGAVLGSAGAAAADEWPPIPPYPSPSVPFDTKDFLTPTDPDYWNPFVSKNRLTSPFGTSTRIVCTAFHGVMTGCWQADENGAPHKLVPLPLNFPGSTEWFLPGGGPAHFVYPIAPGS